MNKENLILRLREIHGDDEDQINFILSDDQKIIVTASAGCGKTKTMISKIAYELVTTPNINSKKILALTFSVNAATKIKEDTTLVLPQLLGRDNFNIDKKLDVSNYHSFSTKILVKHGYILNEKLSNIANFTIVPENIGLLSQYLIASEVITLLDFLVAINEVNIELADNLEEEYIRILLQKLIPNSVMTYNGLLILANRLLKKQSISNFYKRYYPLIIVDEFQDTNFLAYKIITSLIDDSNRVILMGDDIQKIYGFLGAIPDLFKQVAEEYDITPMEFKTNYRFKNNEKMKKLDFYLREIFRKYDNMEDFNEEAEINLGFYKTNVGEADAIVNNMKEKIEYDSKVALLVNIKRNAENVIKKLESEGLRYFNGLFTDTDAVYIKFHRVVIEIFIRESGNWKSTSKRVIDKALAEIELKRSTITNDDILFNSLMRLLDALFKNVKESDLSREDKYNKIIFVLGNNSLKRLMNEIDEDIVLTTIHGSKGLEWDYIYIPEVTESEFPFYHALCKQCKNSGSGIKYDYCCEFTFPKHLKSKFEEQLSLFYVGITRAKKDVFLFANVDNNHNGFTKKRSCLTALPNLTINSEF